MASPDSAAKSAAASATSAAASAQAAAIALENAVEVAGLPTEAAAQAYNIENDPGVKGAMNVHIDGRVDEVAPGVVQAETDAYLPVAGAATYARKRERDPRSFGLTGGADDSAALQACIDDAGAGGTVVLPDNLTINYRTPLVLPTGTKGIEFRGAGNKGSVLQSDVDVACLTGLSGHGTAIRNLVIKNTASARTTYDIDIINPTKTVLEDVEIENQLLVTGGTGCGVRFRKDAGQTGNSFMPQLSRVWIRQGSLVLDGVTDGHFVDGYVWAARNTTSGAIWLKNVSDGWTFASVDVMAPWGDTAGYYLQNTNHTKIVGGYLDGSYDANQTGHGLRAVDSGRIFVTGTNFYRQGRSGIRLENTHGCVFSGVGFYRNNKLDGSHPDIDLINSDNNTFIGTSHSQPDARTNKGAIYREDAASTGNLFDASVLDGSLGNQYATPLAVANPGTLGKRNRPGSLWPRPAGVAEAIVPPASTVGVPAATGWAGVNQAIFHRFTVTDGGVYRYANFRVGTGSGNMQAVVVSLSGSGFADYTRVMDSGVVACTAGNKALDMGATYLAPGEYAIGLWFDNTTATVSRLTDTAVTAMRNTATITGLTSGVPASGAGAIAWGTSHYLGGLTLSQTTT